MCFTLQGNAVLKFNDFIQIWLLTISYTTILWSYLLYFARLSLPRDRTDIARLTVTPLRGLPTDATENVLAAICWWLYFVTRFENVWRLCPILNGGSLFGVAVVNVAMSLMGLPKVVVHPVLFVLPVIALTGCDKVLQYKLFYTK